jgi:hypothetical protein
VIGSELDYSDSKNQAVWVEYGGPESSGTNALDQNVYLDVLTDMDFCISPPGWGWYTHRTVEALVRGSIPILAEPDVYNLDLRDGENCIVVRNGDWRGGTRRALDMRESEVVRMRTCVLALRENSLLPDIVAERFCSQVLEATVKQPVNKSYALIGESLEARRKLHYLQSQISSNGATHD